MVQRGIIKIELGELSPPALSALKDCVDDQGDVCETGENLNDCLDAF